MNEALISIEDAAEKMGVDSSTLRFGLQQNLFSFGTAVKCKKSWRYIIIKARFEKYLSGADMLEHEYISNEIENIQSNIEHSDYQNGIPSEPLFYDLFSAKYDSRKSIIEKERQQQYDNFSENKKLRQYCESSGLFYGTSEVAHILGYNAQSIASFCTSGYFKALNPDGHKWFIEIKPFDEMDPSWLPENCQKRLKKYLNKKEKVDA